MFDGVECLLVIDMLCGMVCCTHLSYRACVDLCRWSIVESLFL